MIEETIKIWVETEDRGDQRIQTIGFLKRLLFSARPWIKPHSQHSGCAFLSRQLPFFCCSWWESLRTTQQVARVSRRPVNYSHHAIHILELEVYSLWSTSAHFFYTHPSSSQLLFCSLFPWVWVLVFTCNWEHVLFVFDLFHLV